MEVTPAVRTSGFQGNPSGKRRKSQNTWNPGSSLGVPRLTNIYDTFASATSHKRGTSGLRGRP